MGKLTEFVEAAKIMAAAAQMVAQEFDAADSRSAEAAAKVNGMLRTAIDQAQARRVISEQPEPPGTGSGISRP